MHYSKINYLNRANQCLKLHLYTLRNELLLVMWTTKIDYFIVKEKSFSFTWLLLWWIITIYSLCLQGMQLWQWLPKQWITNWIWHLEKSIPVYSLIIYLYCFPYKGPLTYTLLIRVSTIYLNYLQRYKIASYWQ